MYVRVCVCACTCCVLCVCVCVCVCRCVCYVYVCGGIYICMCSCIQVNHEKLREKESTKSWPTSDQNLKARIVFIYLMFEPRRFGHL